MRPHAVLCLLAAGLLVLAASTATAQGWLDAVKNKATQAIEKSLEPDSEEPAEPAPADAESAPARSTGAAPAPGGAGPAGAGGQPDLAAVKSDFVPGEKTIFYDDFTDMAGDEPPPHWKVRGGTAELRVGGAIRQLTLATHGMVISPNLQSLPKNFTLETDLQFGTLTGNGNGMIWRFTRLKDGPPTLMVNARVQEEGTRLTVFAGNADNPEGVADLVVRVDPRQPIRFALWVQDGRIRIYLNEQRAMDVNQIALEQINFVDLESIVEDGVPGAYAGVRRARFAESTPDFSKAIASGRYVTHGILFDTDSDRIKPESAPVIRSVARGLETNPGLRLLIEGHTDSTGDSTHNLDLSKRRAEAVKAVLVSQFGVEAARLATAGMGAGKPIASNDTPLGRAENRRVEFVRQ
jgi:outer membrane protein OmpA-like peptidoglycan-associated protein